MSDNEQDDKRPRLRSAGNSKLPLASVIPDEETFQRAIQLLRDGTANKVEQSRLIEIESDIKAELAAICEAYSLPGFRHGLNMFEYQGWKTRTTLSKEKLLELGVSAEQIAGAYVEGKPFLMTKIDPFDMP